MSQSSRARTATTANAVQSIFLNPRFRFLLLRTICFSALIASFMALPTCIGFVKPYKKYHGIDEYSKWFRRYSMAFFGPFLIFLHHFASAFGPRSTLPGILDVILLVLEIAGLGATARWWLYVGTDANETTSYFALLCLLTGCLGIYLLMRFAETIKRSGRNLWMVTDISDTCWTRPDANPSRPCSHLPTEPCNGRRTGIQVLSGTSIWEERCVGEAKWLIVSRGLFAALLLVAVAGFAFFNLILAPVIEGAMVPMKELRLDYESSRLEPDLHLSETIPINVVVTALDSLFNSSSLMNAALQDAISVRGVLPPPYDATDAAPDCQYFPDRFQVLKGYGGAGIFRCGRYYDWDNDILVTVNFTSLPIVSNERRHLSWQSVYVMLSYTDNIKQTVTHTKPTLLLPGIDLIGIADVHLQQTFKNRALSAFGMFDAMDTFLVSDMEIFSDPKASQGAEMASIRMHYDGPLSYRVIQDYRESSVLIGFSKVGGLWAFLGGVFATIFGSSILRIVLGIKPLSVFGVAHSFQEKQMREACTTEYPRLQSDIKMQTNKGLLSFVSDQIFDLNFLEKEETEMREKAANPPAQVGDIEKELDPDNDTGLHYQDLEGGGDPEMQPFVPDNVASTSVPL